jgi:hypothetical protein
MEVDGGIELAIVQQGEAIQNPLMRLVTHYRNAMNP